MTQTELYIYLGSAVSIIWGILHLLLTVKTVKGFGEISADNKKVLTMEIISEGLTLIFLGVLPVLIIQLGYPIAVNAFIVYRVVGGMLLVMALVTLFTASRTPATWQKINPAVKTVAAALFIVGSLI